MTLSPGDRLGRYEIQSRLGAGGMGEVYRAVDTRLGRRVAVKVLPARLIRDPGRRELFEHEARATAALNHPNVLTIHDFGVHAGVPFLVCELLDGETLRRRLRAGRLPGGKVIDYGLQIAHGLAAAHENGVVHCDLKPTNLFLTAEEQVKILDFGLARIVRDEGAAKAAPGLPATAGRHFGTMGYQAPEQLDGKEVDPRSDLFAFGAVLYEMLWGEPAFVRKTAVGTLSAILGEDPARRGESELDRLIARCLEKDPDRRFPSARDVALRLLELAAEEGVAPATTRVSAVDPASPPPPLTDDPTSGSGVGSSSGSVALFQLPRPPDDFVGRLDALRELTRAVAQGEASLVGIHGMGGVGKTSLALKLAMALVPRYPDALLYLDLKGAGDEPVSPAQAMAHVIRAFLPQAATPEELAAVTGQYRSVLHGQHALLLMDNAASREQVEPLVPPEGSLLLTTSRRRFVLPGQLTKDLDTLPREDAVALLRRIAPRVGEGAGRVAELCGDLPIALRLAGSALAERPDLDPAAYAVRLEAGRRRLELAEAAFALSFDLLSAELREAWCDLAVFPGTFTAEAAAAVWDRDVEEAEDLLGEIVLVSLVEWAGGRYRLHDLAAAFARERWTGERRELRQRHARHYLGVLRRARALFDQGGKKASRGIKHADREWANIDAGWKWSEQHAESSADAAALCSAYARTFATYVAWRRSTSEMVRELEIALAAARRLADPESEAIHLGNLGVHYALSGDIEHALEASHLELDLVTAARDLPRILLTKDRLGMTYALQGKYERAVEFLQEMLDTAREMGEPPVIATIGNLGLCYLELGDVARAQRLFERHLVLARETDEAHQISQALQNMGGIYYRLGQLQEARKALEKSLEIAREIGDWYHECGALEDLGRIWLDLGERGRAVEHFEEQLEIATRFDDRQAMTQARWRLGEILEAAGEHVKAAEAMQPRVDYRKHIGHAEADADAARVRALRAAPAPPS